MTDLRRPLAGAAFSASDRQSDLLGLNHTTSASATPRWAQLAAIAQLPGCSDDNVEAAQHDLALEFTPILIREDSHHE
jgi:hypothetical protein